MYRINIHGGEFIDASGIRRLPTRGNEWAFDLIVTCLHSLKFISSTSDSNFYDSRALMFSSTVP